MVVVCGGIRGIKADNFTQGLEGLVQVAGQQFNWRMVRKLLRRSKKSILRAIERTDMSGRNEYEFIAGYRISRFQQSNELFSEVIKALSSFC